MISDYPQNVWSQDGPVAAHVDHVVSGLPNICPGRFGTLLIASLVFKCDQPYLDATGMSPAGRRSCFPTKPCLGIEVCNLTSSAGKVSLVEVSRNVVFVLRLYEVTLFTGIHVLLMCDSTATCGWWFSSRIGLSDLRFTRKLWFPADFP